MKLITYFSFLVIIFFNNYAYGCKPEIFNGEYLRDDVHKYLKKYKFKNKDQPKGMLGIVIEREDDKKYLTFLWNMHEGDIQREITNDCFLIRIDGANELAYRIQAISPNTIRLSQNLSLYKKFTKVSSIEGEVNKWLIEGKYLNQAGKTYSFSRNGIATIDGEKYNYRVIIDRVDFQRDVVVITDQFSSKIYGIDWDKNKLRLSEYSNDSQEFNSSIAILTPN